MLEFEVLTAEVMKCSIFCDLIPTLLIMQKRKKEAYEVTLLCVCVAPYFFSILSVPYQRKVCE
jgi:hypothetical protein